MITELFKVLTAGLTLLNTKESRKYIDEVIELKKEWYEEYNLERPDMANLDNIKFKLRTIGDTFSSQVGVEGAKNKS